MDITAKIRSALVIAAGLCLLAPAASADENTLETIKKRGEIQLLITNNYPYQFKEPGKDEWIGYNMDLAQILATELKIKAVATEVTWATLVPSLMAKKGDIVWTAASMTTARAQVVWFTQPSSYTSNNIVIKKSDDRFKTLEDFNNDKVTFAVFPGAPESLVRSLFPLVKIRSLTGDNPQLPRLEVVAGRADASITDYDTAVKFAEANPTAKVWEVAPVSVTGNHFLVRPGEDHFVRFMDSFIQDLRNRGTLKALGEKWKVRVTMPVS
jgi:polar amino acid transport system substrate-binding protein